MMAARNIRWHQLQIGRAGRQELQELMNGHRGAAIGFLVADLSEHIRRIGEVARLFIDFVVSPLEDGAGQTMALLKERGVIGNLAAKRVA